MNREQDKATGNLISVPRTRGDEPVLLLTALG